MKSIPPVSFSRLATIAFVFSAFLCHPVAADDQVLPAGKPTARAKADPVPGMQGTKVRFDFNTLDMSEQTLLQIWPAGFGEESSIDPKGTTSKPGPNATKQLQPVSLEVFSRDKQARQRFLEQLKLAKKYDEKNHSTSFAMNGQPAKYFTGSVSNRLGAQLDMDDFQLLSGFYVRATPQIVTGNRIRAAIHFTWKCNFVEPPQAVEARQNAYFEPGETRIFLLNRLGPLRALVIMTVWPQ